MAKHTASVISIGDELLRGQVINTNSAFIAAHLHCAGYKLLKIITLPDEVQEIATEVAAASKHCSVVFTCGGVGPTHDDVTHQAIAEALNSKLEVNNQLRNLYSDLSSDPLELDLLATVPANSEIIEVKHEYNKCTCAVIKLKNVYVLPGSPKYLRPAVLEIMPKIRTNTVPFSTTIDVALSELSILKILNEQVERWKDSVHFGSYPQSGTEIHTMITLEGNRKDTLNAKKNLISSLPSSVLIPKIIFTRNNALEIFQSMLNQPHIRKAISLIEECYNVYKPSETFICFNGGKDCTVVLHLVAAVLYLREVDSKECFYLTGDQFPEVDVFVNQAADFYGFHLIKKEAPIKSSLHSLISEKPNVKACLMGTRRNDPASENLQPFDMTDPGWPQLMRVNPILDWSYKQVWDFILEHNIPYCSLYDQGFSSLGTKSKTLRNPLLQDPENPEKYLPAHSLLDDSAERQGRTIN